MSEPVVPPAPGSAPSQAVYLCQISETVSCGACCGLYNIKSLSQDRLEALLSSRTQAFASVPRTEDDIYAFQQKIERSLPKEKPFPEFHHCPFVGLIGADKNRIGCLLHPNASGNEGKDFRWMSWYGAMACRIYFCPTSRMLPPVYQMIIRETIDHWYLYGLIITEHRLLAAFFRETEMRMARKIVASDFNENRKARAIFREFAGLKLDWPYRQENAPGPCHHVFDNGEYPRPNVQRANSAIPLSRYEDIFRELDSGFLTTEAMFSAEARLDDLFARLVTVLSFP
ncbi:MAG: hypothetical protein RBT11_10835 [Desulfobacterales bacterium]|nr:hypothetical protein [Desulfobacterales bacterium]